MVSGNSHLTRFCANHSRLSPEWVWEGHGFSRAAELKKTRALASEVQALRDDIFSGPDNFLLPLAPDLAYPAKLVEKLGARQSVSRM